MGKERDLIEKYNANHKSVDVQHEEATRTESC